MSFIGAKQLREMATKETDPMLKMSYENSAKLTEEFNNKSGEQLRMNLEYREAIKKKKQKEKQLISTTTISQPSS